MGPIVSNSLLIDLEVYKRAVVHVALAYFGIVTLGLVFV